MPRKRKAPQPVATPHHSGEELLQPSTSSPRVPEIRVVRARTAQPDDESGHDEPGGSYLEPPGARSRSKVSRWYMRKLSRKSSGPDRPGTLDPQDSVLPSLEDSELSESQCSSPQNIDSSPSAPSTHLVLDANTSLRTRLEHAGMGTALPPPSNSTSSSSAGPAGDGKKPTVSAIKFILQIATSALKISPVPYLNEIPGLLLTLLQACETVDSNNENLKGLNDEVRSAYTTILRPLQLCTGQIPSEVVFLLKEFHSTLEEQIKHIDSLRAQGLMKRIILASNIAQSISNVNACINKAIASFSTEATTLTLLQTIQSSMQSELSRLGRVPAEHTYVQSKSECHPGTRVGMHQSVLGHLKESTNRFVWLRGSPGTGKTAICMSVTSTLESQGTLAASFFWDKNQAGTGLDSIDQFPSTLAHQLAAFNEDFKISLVRHLRQPSLAMAQHLPLKKQMRALIIEPMRNLMEGLLAGEHRFIIVLDGLDECGSQTKLDTLMDLVFMLRDLPTTFAILVSCRPEPQVVSAFAEAKDSGYVIPCEDVDLIEKSETFFTVRCMIEEGLRDRIKKSKWKPSEEDLDAFASACRELPVIASIRVRDVGFQTQHGRTLQSEFLYYRDLTDAPADLNSEYLRILRRAYMADSSVIHPDVAKKYRLVVGMILAARRQLSLYSLSQLLRITEDEVCAILEPISSIIDLPSKSGEKIKFYHATTKEFITGPPIGNENDHVFFINDPKGYSFGLPLLQYFNDLCEQNWFRMPSPPLGDEEKWGDFRKHRDSPPVKYVVKYLFWHLDPSKLFSQESSELEKEFHHFLSQNLLTFKMVSSSPPAPSELLRNRTTELLKEVNRAPGNPWDLYRSFLPFTPSSSPLRKVCGHRFDPIRIFSISGEFSGHMIPLSEKALGARKLMEAKLDEWQKKSGQGKKGGIDYESAFCEPDVRNGVVTCAAISPNGHYIALAFGSGIIEISDIDKQHAITRFECDPPCSPAWVEFIHGNLRIATEDINGNITILDRGMEPIILGTLASGHYPAVTVVSDNGLLIARAPQDLDGSWYNAMTLLHVSGDPRIQLLAPPNVPILPPDFRLPVPHRHTIGFSPGARYIGAFDGASAFTWSTESCDSIAYYHVTNFSTWFLNPGIDPPCSYFIPDLASIQRPSETDYLQHPATDREYDSDESWIKCPFYDLQRSLQEPVEANYSSATGRALLHGRFSEGEHLMHSFVWFNGKRTLEIPTNYVPIACKLPANSNEPVAWYGDRVPGRWLGDQLPFRFESPYCPRSSRDGTRFVLQGRMKAPIVVDISQVI